MLGIPKKTFGYFDINLRLFNMISNKTTEKELWLHDNGYITLEDLVDLSKKHFGDKYDLKYFIIETFEDSYVEYDNQAILLGNYFIITLKD